MEIWKSGELLYLENEEAEGEAIQKQKERHVDECWLNQAIPKQYWNVGSDVDTELLEDQENIEKNRTYIREIWEYCFKEDISRLNPRDENRIGRCMK